MKKNKPSAAHAALASLSALLMTPVLAQQPAPEGARLKEVSVSATRTERDVDEVPATVSVIPAAEIERTMVRDMKDLIRYEPGIEIPTNTSGSPQFSANPQRAGNQGFSIRGVEGNRVQILVDGVRLPDAYSLGSFAGANRDLVDMDALSRVEILRGPASTLYGSDALGGVVSFTTYDPAELLKPGNKFAARLRAGFSTVDESMTASVGGAFFGDNIAGLLFFSRRDGRELDNQGTESGAFLNNFRVRTEPNPENYANTGLLGKIILKINASNALRLTADVRNQKNSFLALNAVGTQLTGANRYYSDARGNDEFKRDRYSLDWTYTGNARDAISGAKVMAYTQSTRTEQLTDNLFAVNVTNVVNRQRHQYFDYKSDTQGVNIQLESRPNWGGFGHRLIYGMEWYRTDAESLRDGFQRALPAGVPTATFGTDVYPVRDFPNSRTKLTAFFAQDEMQVARLTLIPGIRRDSYELTPSVDSIFAGDHPGVNPVSLKFSGTSPKLGALYQLTETTSLYGQVARGFRAPPFNDVNLAFVNNVMPFGAGNYTSIANPNLKAETSTGFEAGVRGAYASGSYGVTFFTNRYKDFIDSLAALNCPGNPACVPLFDFTFQSINRAKVEIHGVEAKGDYKLARDWTLRGAFAWAQGDDKSAGVPLNSIAPMKLVTGLRWGEKAGPRGAEAILTVVDKKRRIDRSPYISGTPAVAFPAFSPKGYATVDLLGWWRPAGNVTVNAGIFNLFDTKYWQWNNVRLLNANAQNLDYFTSPGRNASVTAKVEF